MMNKRHEPNLLKLVQELAALGYGAATLERWSARKLEPAPLGSRRARTADEVTVAQAATLLGVHPNTVKRWCDEGRLGCRRTLTRYRLIRRQEIARLLSRGCALLE